MASQVTALEIWLLACILLVFGALAEYAFILRQVIKLSRKTNGSADSPSALASPNNCGVGGEASTMMKVCAKFKTDRLGKTALLNCLRKVPNDRSLSRLQSPSRVVQAAGGGGGGIAFKLNGGMEAAAMAEMTRSTSGE